MAYRSVSNRFLITTAAAPWLQGKVTIIGQALGQGSFEDIAELDRLGTRTGRVSSTVQPMITKCGMLSGAEPRQEAETQASEERSTSTQFSSYRWRYRDVL